MATKDHVRGGQDADGTRSRGPSVSLRLRDGKTVPDRPLRILYHHRIAAPADLPAFLREVRDWARGPYAQALAQGQNLPDADRQAIRGAGERRQSMEGAENVAGAVDEIDTAAGGDRIAPRNS